MAGDWIKIEKATARKPEVLRLADILGINPDHAFGLCFRFWCWCDDQLTTGHAIGVTNVTLDMVIGHAGFATGLVKVGWLEVRDGALQVPNFDRHLSDSAKNRALSGNRKQKQRSDVTKMSRKERDKNGTKAGPEKRREELSISVTESPEIIIPEKMRTPEVSAAAKLWMSHLSVTAPDKLPEPDSPQAQAFWREASRLGPDRFCAAVEHSVARGWKNLRERDERPAAATPGASGKRKQEVDW